MKTLNDYEMPKKTIKKRKNNSNTSISLNNSNNMLILYIKSIDHNYLDKKVNIFKIPQI